MKKYKIYAVHEKGEYDPGFEELYVTEKGLKDFIKKFKESKKDFREMSIEDLKYHKDRIEWYPFTIFFQVFHQPKFLDSVESFEVTASDGGYEDTHLYMENATN